MDLKLTNFLEVLFLGDMDDFFCTTVSASLLTGPTTTGSEFSLSETELFLISNCDIDIHVL